VPLQAGIDCFKARDAMKSRLYETGQQPRSGSGSEQEPQS